MFRLFALAVFGALLLTSLVHRAALSSPNSKEDAEIRVSEADSFPHSFSSTDTSSGLNLIEPVVAIEDKVPADKPVYVKYSVEPYTANGKVNGCGLSFDVAWINNSDKIMYVVVGAMSSHVVDGAQLAMYKVGGVVGGKREAVTYAWMDVPGYGSTKTFRQTEAMDKLNYVAGKQDAWFELINYASTNGFDLGVHFNGLPMDAKVHLPPLTEAKVVLELADCGEAIAKGM